MYSSSVYSGNGNFEGSFFVLARLPNFLGFSPRSLASGCGHGKDGSASAHRSIVGIFPVSFSSLPTDEYLPAFSFVRTLYHAGDLSENTRGRWPNGCRFANNLRFNG